MSIFVQANREKISRKAMAKKKKMRKLSDSSSDSGIIYRQRIVISTNVLDVKFCINIPNRIYSNIIGFASFNHTLLL